MGRVRLVAVQCNYEEIDRQLKEQFIHGLNDNDMLAEIIGELIIKAEESTAVTIEQTLIWAKRVGAQRAQYAMIISLSKTKEFDKIKTIKGTERQSGKTSNTCRNHGNTRETPWRRYIDTGNINSINFHSKWLVLTANLKTLSNQSFNNNII